MQPIAEILAVAWVVQQLQLSLGRFRTMEVMSEITLSIAAEINSALQAIIGHCDLIRREYADERLARDLDTVGAAVRSASRSCSSRCARPRQPACCRRCRRRTGPRP